MKKGVGVTLAEVIEEAFSTEPELTSSCPINGMKNVRACVCVCGLTSFANGVCVIVKSNLKPVLELCGDGEGCFLSWALWELFFTVLSQRPDMSLRSAFIKLRLKCWYYSMWCLVQYFLLSSFSQTRVLFLFFFFFFYINGIILSQKWKCLFCFFVF